MLLWLFLISLPRTGFFDVRVAFFFPFRVIVIIMPSRPSPPAPASPPPRNQAVMMHCPRSSSAGHSAQAEGEPSAGSGVCRRAMGHCPAARLRRALPAASSFRRRCSWGPPAALGGSPLPLSAPRFPPLQPHPGGGGLPAPPRCLGDPGRCPRRGRCAPRSAGGGPCPALRSAAGRAGSTCLRCPP